MRLPGRGLAKSAFGGTWSASGFFQVDAAVRAEPRLHLESILREQIIGVPRKRSSNISDVKASVSEMADCLPWAASSRQYVISVVKPLNSLCLGSGIPLVNRLMSRARPPAEE